MKKTSDERRRYPRQNLKATDGITATLILPGTSLVLRKGGNNQIEIQGRPADIGRGGVCIEISFEAPWQSIVNRREIDLLLEKESYRRLFKARVAHSRMGHKVIGVAFEAPIGDVAPWLLPPELQEGD